MGQQDMKDATKLAF